MNFFERLSYWWRTKRWRTPDEERGWRVVECKKHYTASDFKSYTEYWWEIEFYHNTFWEEARFAEVADTPPFHRRVDHRNWPLSYDKIYRFNSLDEAFDFASKHFSPTARVRAR